MSVNPVNVQPQAAQSQSQQIKYNMPIEIIPMPDSFISSEKGYEATMNSAQQPQSQKKKGGFWGKALLTLATLAVASWGLVSLRRSGKLGIDPKEAGDSLKKVYNSVIGKAVEEGEGKLTEAHTAIKTLNDIKDVVAEKATEAKDAIKAAYKAVKGQDLADDADETITRAFGELKEYAERLKSDDVAEEINKALGYTEHEGFLKGSLRKLAELIEKPFKGKTDEATETVKDALTMQMKRVIVPDPDDIIPPDLIEALKTPPFKRTAEQINTIKNAGPNKVAVAENLIVNEAANTIK